MSSRFRKRLKQSSSSLTGVSKRKHSVSHETLTESTSQLTLVNDHEVGVTILVDLADSTEQEANASVLKKIKTSLQNLFLFPKEDNRIAHDDSPHRQSRT